MSDCNFCKIEKECYYPFKPCDCVSQRKFWSKERREEYDASENPESITTNTGTSSDTIQPNANGMICSKCGSSNVSITIGTGDKTCYTCGFSGKVFN